MASRIPTVAERGQAVGSVDISRTTGPMQSLQTDADMFGAAQARTLQQASEGINGIAAVFKQKAEDDDALTILENDNNTTQFKLDLLHNPETGLLTRQGKNAIGMSDEAVKKFDEYAASLPQPKTEAGRLAQQEKLLKMKAAMVKTASVHERGQVEAYKTGQIETAIANAQQEMQTLYNDPAALTNGEKSLRGEAATYAKRLGMSPEAEAEYVEQQVSAGYKKAIDAAVAAQDYKTAKGLLEANTDKLQPDDRDAAREAVQNATVLGEAQGEHDRIMSMQGDPREKLAAAQQIDDPMIRAKTEALVKASIDAEYTFKNREISDRFDRVAVSAKNGEAVNEADLQGFDHYQRAHVERLQYEAKQRAADPDWNRVTDPDKLSAFYEERAGDGLKDLTWDQLVAKYETGVDVDKWEKLVVPAWTQARLDAGKQIEARAMKLSEEQRKMAGLPQATQIGNALRKVGITSEANPDEYAAFEMEYQARITAAGAATNTDKYRVLLDMMSERIVYDKTDVWGGGDDDVTYPSILVNDRDMMETMASDLGIKRSERAGFVDRLPSVINQLRRAETVISRQSIRLADETIRALPAAQRQQFTLNLAGLINTLKQNKKAISQANLIALWNRR